MPVEAIDAGFKVLDANGQPLAYVYGHARLAARDVRTHVGSRRFPRANPWQDDEGVRAGFPASNFRAGLLRKLRRMGAGRSRPASMLRASAD